MTTSFTRTRQQLADMTLRKLGVTGNVSSQSVDMELVYEAIDLRLKAMHTDGIFWRKVTQTPVTFSLGSGIVSASAGAGDILFPLSMTFKNGSVDDAVQIIGPREYAAISDKARTGNPEKALWKGGSEFWLYPVPSANGTAKLVYEKIADDSSSGSAVDVDVSMLRWLKDILAYDLADDFGVAETKVQRLMRESAIAERRIRRLNALRIDYDTVAVDSWDTPTGRETDY